MDKYSEIFNFIDEVQETLSMILSSGFSTCHEYTIEKIKDLKEKSNLYGMEYAAKTLEELHKALALKKHNFEFDFDSAIEKYCYLNEYFLICKEKLEAESVKSNMIKR